MKKIKEYIEQTADNLFMSDTKYLNEGLIYYLKKEGINPYNKHIVICGYWIKGCVEALVQEGASVTYLNMGARRKNDYFSRADLIICNGYRLNCYTIHVPVIDLQNTCVNTEDRDVVHNSMVDFDTFGRLTIK